MRHLRHLAITIGLSALAGCESDGPLSVREVRELRAARERWLSSSVRRAYTFEVRQSCFCSTEYLVWNTVTVVNDSIVDVRVTEGDRAVRRESWNTFLTVEKMFASLSTGDSQFLDDIRVTFDLQYGYPRQIDVITTTQIADGGGAAYARNLRPASGNP